MNELPMNEAQYELEYERAVRIKKSILHHQLQDIEINAKKMYRRFEALVKEGFTNEQALEIVIRTPTDQ